MAPEQLRVRTHTQRLPLPLLYILLPSHAPSAPLLSVPTTIRRRLLERNPNVEKQRNLTT